jgi:sodium transport system ATP-binding protein
MIEVANLTKTFLDLRRGEVPAVAGISFSCCAGEIFGLLGPNGAGKTTALRILSTILRPTGGHATVAGYDVVRDAAQVRKNIGYMSASTGIYDRMTAWELVEYFGRLYGVPDQQLHERMEYLFETLQMNGFRDLLASKMSTGMRQKVSIARTIVHDPPVLIFDEPTAGLDVLVARAVLETIKSLREEGKCIVFSTHIMREAEKLCDQIAIIHRGKILDRGTLDELTTRHGEADLEDVFFGLIRRHDSGLAESDAEARTAPV